MNDLLNHPYSKPHLKLKAILGIFLLLPINARIQDYFVARSWY